MQRVLTAVLPGLRAQGSGLVINISSVFGRIVMPFFGLYGSSKFALEAISDSYRYELSQFGVDVVLIQPSAYPTDIFASSLLAADTERITSYGQLGEVPAKVGQSITDSFKGDNPPNPHDVAEAIVKLVAQADGSRPARVIVGQPFGADHLNGQAETVQSKAMEAVGLSFLETHPSAPAKT